jgi:pyruvate/2-oxoglutarate dehydrogenase complex dihydrolipoamide dehydrogenase (E3) component
MRRKGKAVGVGETAGFIKVVVEAGTDRLLGAAVLANDGQLDLMNAGAPYQAHSIESAGVDHA